MHISDNASGLRFEATVDGQVAFLTYRRRDDRLVLIHTEVPDALEGRGIGGALVAAAVAHEAEHDLTVVPRCPFAREWLARHPDDAGRVRVEPPS